jgi:3'(2'), 5'-bisphosphate nucleotidase
MTMTEPETMTCLTESIVAAIDAGSAILDVYDSNFEVELKADQSPLTLADRKAHHIIEERLKPLGLPILSEEGRHMPFEDRRSWQRFFLVDPLDGTKEFIKRNGEFTVNIALVEGHTPVMGVIVVPVKGVLYFAAPGLGARRVDDIAPYTSPQGRPDPNAIIAAGHPLPIRPSDDRPYTVIGSRSHGSPELEDIVNKLKDDHGEVAFVSAGSSLKLCRVAEGSADIYPRTGPTCEWDTGAGQAIAEQAGCAVTRFGTETPLRYNKEDLLNPWFVVERAPAASR